jgi:agmatine deiminase
MTRMCDEPAAAEWGFAMPPAWAPHARSWMAWPCRKEIWRDGIVAARRAYAEVARAIARFEPVIMAARPRDAEEARALCGPSVEIWEVPLDDSWARDIAPVFVKRAGEVAGVDWDFNGWGGKYRPHAEDTAFAGRLLSRQGLRRFEGGMVLEGGAIATDGAGTLLTTEECLLNPNRNPGLSRAEIEAKLRDHLGANRIVWLGKGLVGDETDGHVDNVACFAPDGRVLLAIPDENSDPNYVEMRTNGEWLRAANIDCIPVPLPKSRDGLIRSYINFAVTNGGLIIPAFDDPLDDEAARVIAESFPGREIVQIDANPIVVGGGGLHCITYEEPR